MAKFLNHQLGSFLVYGLVFGVIGVFFTIGFSITGSLFSIFLGGENSMLLAFIPIIIMGVVVFPLIIIGGLSVYTSFRDIFYREAGSNSKPTILMLHGFPSSSHMYRDLIKDLSEDFHLIAPDYPGFGQSSSPLPSGYDYSFQNLAVTIDHFIDVLGLKKFSLYVQDYGGPVGFRIAAQRPELIQALIIQNANAYNEGLGDALKPLVDHVLVTQ